jgi:Ni/Fe-hydrogenase subunit HybB-like protein
MKSGSEMVDEIRRHEQHPGQKTWITLSGILAIIGTGAFLTGISGPSAGRAWQAYLVNFLFWSGLAFGMVLFSATLTMSKARWGRPMKRLAESAGAFLPVALLLFWVLYFGRERIFIHPHESLGHKQLWLSSGFLFARDGLSLLALTVVSLLLVTFSVQRDLKLVAAAREGRFAGAGHEGQAADPQSLVSPIFGILYAIVLSLIGFDLIMSLNPHWHSTLFGAYYFVGSFYSGLAALAVLSYFSVKRLGLGEVIQGKHFHDLANLMLAFCLVTGDFFYSQFLVIWFADLPHETRFVLTRVREDPWSGLAWTVLFVCFAIPFVVLLSRNLKKKPAFMMVLAVFILVGMWLERFLLVVPSLWQEGSIPLGLMEMLITAGFFGIMAVCVLLFLRKFPILPVSDPLL